MLELRVSLLASHNASGAEKHLGSRSTESTSVPIGRDSNLRHPPSGSPTERLWAFVRLLHLLNNGDTPSPFTFTNLMQLDLRSAAFILVFPDDFVLSKLQYIDSGCVTLACCLEHVFPFGLH